MIEHKSLTAYRVKDRGVVFMVEAPFDFTDRSVLLGPCIIDGTPYNVKAVEAYAMVKISKGTVVGLLVDESKPQAEGGK